MKHGEERNRERKQRFSSIDLKTADGEAMTIDYCSSELDVAEKWCEHCNDWVSTEGLGLFGFVLCPICKNEW